MEFKDYTKEIATALDAKYTDLVENIFANDVAFDLSTGICPADVYLSRCSGINRYHRSSEQSREIFKFVFDLMKKGEKK